MRTTATKVKAIIDTDLTDDAIDAYIESANIMVTNVMSGATASSDLLAEIERWLTAHMIASSKERIAKEEGAGGAYIKYTGDYGKNLSSTSYGQMVTTLDTTGRFASAGLKKVIIKAISQVE